MKLVFDTNIIIESHVFDVWSQLKVRAGIIVTDGVLDEVSHFCPPGSLEREIIDKSSSVLPFVKVENPTPEDLMGIVNLFNDPFLNRMDPGEREIVALAYAGKFAEDCKICTADVPAIEALALVDRKEMGISFEEVLGCLGLRKNLRRSLGAYTKTDFEKALESGAIAKIQETHFRR